MDSVARRWTTLNIKKVNNINNFEEVFVFPQAPEHLFRYQAGLPDIDGAAKESQKISLIGLNGSKKRQQRHARCPANDGAADNRGSGPDRTAKMVSVSVVGADTARDVKILRDGGRFRIKNHEAIRKK